MDISAISISKISDFIYRHIYFSQHHEELIFFLSYRNVINYPWAGTQATAGVSVHISAKFFKENFKYSAIPWSGCENYNPKGKICLSFFY